LIRELDFLRAHTWCCVDMAGNWQFWDGSASFWVKAKVGWNRWFAKIKLICRLFDNFKNAGTPIA
jgi:hypothetical protein